MATVQKLKEGVFLINWDVGYAQDFYQNHDQRKHYIQKASAYIKEISTSCELTCMRPATCNNNKSVFQLIIKRIRFIRSQRRVGNLWVDSPKQVISQNDLINKGENLVPEVLEPSSVLVIINGTSHVMQLDNSTWNTEFIRTSLCACGRSRGILNVFIDFNSTSIITETKQVKKHLLNLWETKTLADVTFKFKEKEVQAHALIVASGSPVLAAMFQHDFKEKQERVVVIKDSKSIVFEKMLHFFYIGDADLNIVDVADLLILADKYGVDSLKGKCALFMAENLTVDNVILYLVVSHLHQSRNLKKAALVFISRHSVQIVTREDWLSLMKDYRELCSTVVKVIVLTHNKRERRKAYSRKRNMRKGKNT